MDNATTVRNLRRQQAAIASFGSFSLRQNDLMTILTEAARVCAEGLSVPFCKVCRYRPDTNDLLIEAGFGWKDGVIGHVVSRADESSPQGRAFVTGEPSICNDLRQDNQFRLPAFYAAHGIVSTIDVLIKGDGRPYGVLEIDSDILHIYDQHDIDFLTGFANILAEGVATAARSALMRDHIRQMKVLAEELQHRVRNNLQLIYGMLNKQLNDTNDLQGRLGIRAISRRVSTLAQVYDHLLGNEMSRSTDFGSYVKSLCTSIATIQGGRSDVTVSCESEQLILDLDQVTALGLVVTELVSNGYDHAYPDGPGEITVSVARTTGMPAQATIVISDNGAGFTVKPDGKRHGIGLVGRLVEQIRGTVTVDSTQGTTWTIKFPLVQDVIELHG